MHPHVLGAFAAERQARMLRHAELARRAREAAGAHRRTHAQTVLGRWTRRFPLGRIRELPAA